MALFRVTVLIVIMLLLLSFCGQKTGLLSVLLFNYSTVSKLFTPLQVFFTVQSFVVLANAVYAYASITVN